MAWLLVAALTQPVNVTSGIESPDTASSADSVSVPSTIDYPVNSPVDIFESPTANAPIAPYVIPDTSNARDPTNSIDDSTDQSVSPQVSPLQTSTFETISEVDCTKNATRSNISSHQGTAGDPFIIADFDDLICMQQLINNGLSIVVNGTSTVAYSESHYWQFNSFDAEGATMSPIGSDKVYRHFSGTVTGTGGSATISNLKIKGYQDVGLFGHAEDFTIDGIHLENVSVTGSWSVGSIVGSIRRGGVSSSIIRNCSVTGTVSGEFNVGGLVGRVPYHQVYFNNVAFDGEVNGGSSLGGLLGSGLGAVVNKAAVRVKINASGEDIGGLVGRVSNSSEGEMDSSVQFNDIVVFGSIAGKEWVGGLVGIPYGYGSSITSVISAVDVSAQTYPAAGLANVVGHEDQGLGNSTLTLKSVLNLARLVTSSNSGSNQAAALIYMGGTALLSASQGYHWQGLSASAATYHPFTPGTVAGNPWKYNGTAVSCADFSRESFWTSSLSMNLSKTSGWDFSKISDGYLPSLNGYFTDQTFSCVNYYTTDNVNSGSIVPWSESETISTLPYYGRANTRVQYFAAATPSLLTVQSNLLNNQTYYNVFLNASPVAVRQQGNNIYTLPNTNPRADNTINLSLASIFCDVVTPNIRDRTGQSNNPFLITNYEELLCMQELVNNNVTFSRAGISTRAYRNGNYWQFRSFDAGGATIKPIGGSGTPFSGYITSAGSIATISNLNIEGTDYVGLFGAADATFNLSGVHLENVSVKGANYVGSIIGYTVGSVTISNCLVSGTVSGTNSVGGLVGAMNPSSPASLKVDNVQVLGSIVGGRYVAGLVGKLGKNVSAIITSVIQAAELAASEGILAGLIIPDHNSGEILNVNLKSVLNVARVTSVPSASFNQAAALVFSPKAAPSTSIASQAYHWLGLSTDSATYYPFSSGTVSGGQSGLAWGYNGEAVNCANFSNENFWTDPETMNLSSEVWNLDAIADGYLPSLNAQSDQTFTCMNTFATSNTVFGLITPWSGSETLPTLPVWDRSTSRVQYFTPATPEPLIVQARWSSGTYFDFYYDVSLNNVVWTSEQTGTNTYTLSDPTPASDNLIRIRLAAPFCDSKFSNIGERIGDIDEPFLITSYPELSCMQVLVNNSVPFLNTSGVGTYQTGNYWQFSSIDAASQTLNPIGTYANPFSGIIIGASGDATISNLQIEGESPTHTKYLGLFAVTTDFTLTGLHLQNVSVVGLPDAGSSQVGSIIGSILDADVTISDCSVSGIVNGALSSSIMGGLVGHLTADSTLSLHDVSFSGSVVGSYNLGGLVGGAEGEVDISDAVFDGPVSGSETLGGLLGYGNDSVKISEVAVRVEINALDINPLGQVMGGLIGALNPPSSPDPTSPVSLSVDNAVVLGSISGSRYVAGLVGKLSQNVSVTLASVIQAADLVASDSLVAGLIIPDHNLGETLDVDLKSVLNMARIASVPSASFNQAAALVISPQVAPSSVTASQAYHWLGLSLDSAAYHPFSSGTVSGSGEPWRYNGEAVNCANFSNENFWTDSESMNLSTVVWNFDTITDGYLPSLNGQFTDQTFSCMNQITGSNDWSDPIAVEVDFGSEILPLVDTSLTFAHYFPANSDTSTAIYRFDTGDHEPFDIIYNQGVGLCIGSNLQNWPLLTGGLFTDGTISLRNSLCTGPEFDFDLTRSADLTQSTDLTQSFDLTQSVDHLWLSWSTKYAQSISISFTTVVNLLGGTPGGMSASKLTYQGTASAGSWDLGPPMAGTYVVSVSGSMVRVGEAVTENIARTLTWTKYLPMIIPQADILFPDVFVGSAKTITYYNAGKVAVSRVAAVKQVRMEAIYWLVSAAVAEGSQSTIDGIETYRAQDTVNRGAMAQFLQRLAGFTDGQIAQIYRTRTSKFTDIGSLLIPDPNRYYAILWLEDTGITAGCNAAGTKFCPNNPVNRGAMAEFLLKLAGVAATPATTSPFPDVNLKAKTLKYDGSRKASKVAAISPARMGAINWLYASGITVGSGAIGGRVTYRPQDPINRGSMAELMRKLALLVGSLP
jgi:hypothetical protein